MEESNIKIDFSDLSVESNLRKSYPTYEKLLNHATQLTIKLIIEQAEQTAFAQDAYKLLQAKKDGKTIPIQPSNNSLTQILEKFLNINSVINSYKASNARYKETREAVKLVHEWWKTDKENNPHLLKKVMPPIYREKLSQFDIQVDERKILRWLYDYK